MNVLLTGHRGYIGGALLPLLLDRDHQVSGLDSDLFAACSYRGTLCTVPEWRLDVRDALGIDLSGFDAVIHLAGLSNDPLGDYDPALTRQINYVGSVDLARHAKRCGVPRFLFASSCSNYGAGGTGFLDECAPFNPITPYGQSKVDVEHALALLADDTFSPTFLRASTAYGLSPRLRFDLVLNNLTAWAYTTGEVYLKSDGSPWRPVVHVEDIALAYLCALQAPRELVHKRAFNVGSTTENYQISELAELVRQIVPGSRVSFAPDAAPDRRCYRVGCNRIATELHDFKPQWTARRGVEQLYDSFCRNGLTLEEFEGERFQRIAHVKALLSDGRLLPDLRWAESLEERVAP